MKISDWKPHRGVLVLSSGVGRTSDRNRSSGMTTDKPPTCEGSKATVELRLDNGCLTKVSVSRVQYPTENQSLKTNVAN
jgi:hypothetical protein